MTKLSTRAELVRLFFCLHVCLCVPFLICFLCGRAFVYPRVRLFARRFSRLNSTVLGAIQENLCAGNLMANLPTILAAMPPEIQYVTQSRWQFVRGVAIADLERQFRRDQNSEAGRRRCKIDLISWDIW